MFSGGKLRGSLHCGWNCGWKRRRERGSEVNRKLSQDEVFFPFRRKQKIIVSFIWSISVPHTSCLLVQIKGYEAARGRSLPRKHQATPQDCFGHWDFLTIESWLEATPTFCYLLTLFLLLLHFDALKTMLLLLCLIPCMCVPVCLYL